MIWRSDRPTKVAPITLQKYNLFHKPQWSWKRNDEKNLKNKEAPVWTPLVKMNKSGVNYCFTTLICCCETLMK